MMIPKRVMGSRSLVGSGGLPRMAGTVERSTTMKTWIGLQKKVLTMEGNPRRPTASGCTMSTRIPAMFGTTRR